MKSQRRNVLSTIHSTGLGMMPCALHSRTVKTCLEQVNHSGQTKAKYSIFPNAFLLFYKNGRKKQINLLDILQLFYFFKFGFFGVFFPLI